MSIDFSGKNLRGYSYKEQDLTGADFSNADLRGANFTRATLRGANFRNAKAGVQWHQIAIALLISGQLGLLAGFVAVWISSFLTSNDSDGIAIGVLSLAELLIFLIITQREGFAKAIGVALSILAGFGPLVGVISIASKQVHVGEIMLETATTSVVAIAVAFTITAFLASSIAVAGRAAITVAFVATLVGASLDLLNSTSERTLNIVNAGVIGIAITLAVAAAMIFLCTNIARLALTDSKQYELIRGIAIAGGAFAGTSFQEADLTNANFAQAILKNTDFRHANLTHTNFHTAKQLERARLGNTILMDSTVRDLVVTHRGVNKNYVGRNLKGANLAGADLRGANLTEADISQAMFKATWLEQANLTKTQAVGTNFAQARLTGACLEAWNIDSTTQLEEIRCDYIYLLNHQQERRPSSGEFAPGEFSKLFQEVLDTVDFIFRNGINWKAFTHSFSQLQIENEDIELSIQSIEHKGDGVIVVRVNVPSETNKATIHAEFIQNYQIALNALEEKYRAELKSKDEQIALQRQHQTDLKELAQMLAKESMPLGNIYAPSVVRPLGSKRVVLKVAQGDLQTGFAITLQIGAEGVLPSIECAGRLAPAPDLFRCYSQWRSAYRKSLNASFRLEIPDAQVTNISRREVFQDCHESALRLQQSLNRWLNDETFQPIREQLLEQLTPSESIRIILQTDDRQLRRLPFQLWEFFDRYSKAEIVLSAPAYKRIEPMQPHAESIRILSVLGDSTGIDIQQDRSLLGQLTKADVAFLVEPQRQELNDYLWNQSWDILFFAGHSSSEADGESGCIHINQRDRLTIPQLKHALRRAIAQGLKLAIFNSCDGLGLAANLTDLHIPQIIVMREPVPDQVAQAFLKNFLSEFSSGKPLYLAVREAREKLQGLEEQFPCATWLPVIYQNPVDSSLTWY